MIKELFLEKIKERKEQEEKTEYIRASEIGNCPLATTLRLKGYEPTIEDEKLLIFEVGNAVHLNFQNVLEEELEDVEKEFTDEELHIKGHIDGRYKDYVIEFKSISPYALKKADLPYKHHIEQVHMYMHLTGLKKAIIVYVDKSSGNIIEYEVEFDSEIFLNLIEKIEKIKTLKEKDIKELEKMKKEDLEIEEWQCKYCLQKENCPIKEG